MVRRHELTDQPCAQLAPLLPRPAVPVAGGPSTRGQVVNGILWKPPPGVPGGTARALWPEAWPQTCYERFRRWQRRTWQRSSPLAFALKLHSTVQRSPATWTSSARLVSAGP